MDRPPPATALETFGRANWNVLRPKLLSIAADCLRQQRWPGMDPEDLVSETIESLLGGARTWVSGTDETEASLMPILRKTMDSIAANDRKRPANKRRADVDPLEVLDQQKDESPSPSRELAAREHVALVAEVLAEDPEALAVHALTYQEYDREEIADELRCSVERVKAVRLRSSRSLQARNLSLDDDGGPPSSSDP